MKFQTVIRSYIAWHYSQAFKEMMHIWFNILRFLFGFFSISILIKTLFNPWKRLSEHYPKNFDMQKTLSAFIVNTLMRIVGAIVRIIVILLGLTVILITLTVQIAIIISWIVLPIAVIAGLIISIEILL